MVMWRAKEREYKSVMKLIYSNIVITITKMMVLLPYMFQNSSDGF